MALQDELSFTACSLHSSKPEFRLRENKVLPLGIQQHAEEQLPLHCSSKLQKTVTNKQKESTWNEWPALKVNAGEEALMQGGPLV